MSAVDVGDTRRTTRGSYVSIARQVSEQTHAVIQQERKRILPVRTSHRKRPPALDDGVSYPVPGINLTGCSSVPPKGPIWRHSSTRSPRCRAKTRRIFLSTNERKILRSARIGRTRSAARNQPTGTHQRRLPPRDTINSRARQGFLQGCTTVGSGSGSTSANECMTP